MAVLVLLVPGATWVHDHRPELLASTSPLTANGLVTANVDGHLLAISPTDWSLAEELSGHEKVAMVVYWRSGGHQVLRFPNGVTTLTWASIQPRPGGAFVVGHSCPRPSNTDDACAVGSEPLAFDVDLAQRTVEPVTAPPFDQGFTFAGGMRSGSPVFLEFVPRGDRPSTVEAYVLAADRSSWSELELPPDVWVDQVCPTSAGPAQIGRATDAPEDLIARLDTPIFAKVGTAERSTTIDLAARPPGMVRCGEGYAAVAAAPGGVRIVDLATASSTTAQDVGALFDIAAGPDGPILATWDLDVDAHDRTLRLIYAGTGESERIALGTASPEAIVISGDVALLAVSVDDRVQVRRIVLD